MMSKQQIYKLSCLKSSDYIKHKSYFKCNNQLFYAVFAGLHICRTLKIEKQAYRLLRSVKDNQQRLVLIKHFPELHPDQILSPFHIIANYGEFVKIIRRPIGIQCVSNMIIPKLPTASQLYIFMNTLSTYEDMIINVLTKRLFVACRKKQTIYLNFNWLEDLECLSQLSHSDSLEVRRFIAENNIGRFTNYLKIQMKAFIQQQTPEQFCLFVPNKTKIVVQRADHFSSIHTIKMSELPQLYMKVFSTLKYKQLSKVLKQKVDQDCYSKMFILKHEEGYGISSFLSEFAQSQSIFFTQIDCRLFVSDSELNKALKNINQLPSGLVYIKNIQWLLEVGGDKNDEQEKMKRLLRLVQNAFNKIDKSNKYLFVIGSTGNVIRYDMTKSSTLIRFYLEKQQKNIILNIVADYYQKQENFYLKNRQEVISLALNNLSWTKFSQILSKLSNFNNQQSENAKTEKVLKEIANLISVQRVQNIKNVSWDDVGGLETAKQQIIQTILLPSKHPEIFDEWIKPRTGLLFFGPPGTGKTLLGKCIANQCKMGFISVKGPQLLNMYIGQSQKNVREVFQRAAASSPCIVFMDQLDALIPKRGQSSDSNQVMDRIVSQLLTQMDKAPSKGIFIIGATNRPDLLDPSILRPGRFDKQIYLGITKDKQSRVQILKAQTRHIRLRQGFNYEKVVQAVPQNFTGADFYGLTSRSISKAAQRFIQEYERKQRDEKDEVQVTEEDFIETAKNMKPSVSLKELDHYERLKKEYN